MISSKPSPFTSPIDAIDAPSWSPAASPSRRKPVLPSRAASEITAPNSDAKAVEPQVVVDRTERAIAALRDTRQRFGIEGFEFLTIVLSFAEVTQPNG